MEKHVEAVNKATVDDAEQLYSNCIKWWTGCLKTAMICHDDLLMKSI